MGYMTEICFLNDGWDSLRKQIEEDPKSFTQAIQELQMGRPVYETTADGRRAYVGREYPGDIDRLMGVGNGSTIYPSHHADDFRLYVAWRNSFRNLETYSLVQEFGARLDTDLVLNVLEREISQAEYALKEVKKLVKERRAAMKGEQ